MVTEIEALKQIRHQNVMKLYAYNLNAKYPTKVWFMYLFIYLFILFFFSFVCVCLANGINKNNKQSEAKQNKMKIGKRKN